MARAVTWSYDPDYSWDHTSPFKHHHETLMTIIVHPSKTGKKEISTCHPGTYKQMDMFYNQTKDEYFFENKAVRKGRKQA